MNIKKLLSSLGLGFRALGPQHGTAPLSYKDTEMAPNLENYPMGDTTLNPKPVNPKPPKP